MMPRASRLLFLAATLAAFLTACGGSKPSGSTTQAANPKPSWISERPISSIYYVGIGQASKQVFGPSAYDMAKRSALNEMASEITVKIEGTGVLSTIESNSGFQEDYIQYIRAKTNEELEGYELAGKWEDENEIWVYYRLSKAEHERIKREKREKAQKIAFDHFKEAKSYERSGDLQSATTSYANAIYALRDYLNEPNEMLDVDGGGRVQLATDSYQAIYSYVTRTKLTASPTGLTMKKGMQTQGMVDIQATYNGVPATSLPLLYKFSLGDGKLNEGQTTDAAGHAQLIVSTLRSNLKKQEVEISVDPAALTAGIPKDPMIQKLFAEMKPSRTTVPITVQMPSAYLVTSESNLGGYMDGNPLGTHFKKILAEEGFSFATDIYAADLKIYVEGQTREGSEMSGMFTSFLDVTVTVTNLSEGSVVYKGAATGLKGSHLSYERAGIEAYQKAEKKLRSDLIDKMLRAIL